jgi:hypothetical protein
MATTDLDRREDGLRDTELTKFVHQLERQGSAVEKKLKQHNKMSAETRFSELTAAHVKSAQLSKR